MFNERPEASDCVPANGAPFTGFNTIRKRPLIVRGLDRIRPTVRDLRSEGRGWILLTIAFGWFLSIGIRLVFPALLPRISATFDVSLTGAGAIVTALWAAYALGQFPGGILGDRVGEGRILVFSTLVTAVVVVGLSAASGLGVFFVATILFGLATALYGPTRFTVLSDIYADRDGAAIGLTMAAGSVGNAVLPVVAATIAAYTTWRFGFAFAAPLFLVTAVGLWRIVPGRTSGPTSTVDELSLSSIRRVVGEVSSRPALLITGVLLFENFVWQAFTGFYPTYLIEVKGFSSQVAAVVYGLFFASGVVVQSLGGATSDRIGMKPTLVGAAAVVAVALSALPVLENLPGLIACTVLVSAAMAMSPAALTYLVNALPEEMQGSGLGLLRMTYMLLASVGPVVVGALADRGFFDGAFFLLAGVIGLALACSLFLPSRV